MTLTRSLSFCASCITSFCFSCHHKPHRVSLFSPLNHQPDVFRLSVSNLCGVLLQPLLLGLVLILQCLADRWLPANTPAPSVGHGRHSSSPAISGKNNCKTSKDEAQGNRSAGFGDVINESCCFQLDHLLFQSECDAPLSLYLTSHASQSLSDLFFQHITLHPHSFHSFCLAPPALLLSCLLYLKRSNRTSSAPVEL